MAVRRAPVTTRQPEESRVPGPLTDPMDYLTVRTVHIAAACISTALFKARGAMQLGGIDCGTAGTGCASPRT